jgi:hypothetical protein
MSSITSYTTLVEALQAAAEDDGAEFEAFLPTAIDLAEELLFKELELPDLEDKVTGTLTQDSNTLLKPTGYKFGNYLKIVVDGENVLLQKRRDDYIQDYWPDPTVTGVPKYYADSSSTEFILAPTPDSGYVYELKATIPPVKLSTSNQTNYFITECQDILFAACMLEMAKFMKAWSQIQVWQGAYSTARDSWNMNSGRTRRDDGSIPNTPDSGPNTLKHTAQSTS